MKDSCKNCNHPVEKNFCPNCGQNIQTKRINFPYLIQQLILGVFHVDKGFFYTAKELLIRPGTTLRNYLDGKRVRYFKPFGFLFLTATIYTFLAFTLNISFDIENTGAFNTDNNSTTHLNSYASWFLEHYAISNLAFLPFIALASWLVYKKEKYNYGENIILAAYISGQLNLSVIVFFPLFYWLNIPTVTMHAQLWITLVIYIYMYANVFNNYSLGIRFIKVLVFTLLNLLFISLTSFIAMLIYSLINS